MQKTKPKEMRERGIYALPDKREFIACRSGDGAGYLLYDLQKRKLSGPADYRAHADGRLLSRGVATRWHFEDLVDTGRTASHM